MTGTRVRQDDAIRIPRSAREEGTVSMLACRGAAAVVIQSGSSERTGYTPAVPLRVPIATDRPQH